MGDAQEFGAHVPLDRSGTFAAWFVLACCASGYARAANTVPGDPLAGDGDVVRAEVTFAQLTANNAPSRPVNDAAFGVPARAAMPLHQFEGSITLLYVNKNGSLLTIEDQRSFFAPASSTRKHLPPMTLEFVQNGSHLIPTVQGLVIGGHPDWNYIVGTGRVWRENGDRNWSRASLPFALIQRSQNCTHNGLMTFLFNETSVSRVRYQITQETCLYLKFNLWGQLSAITSRYAVNNGEMLRNEHADEIAHLMPTRPVAELATNFPNSGVEIKNFTADIREQKHITTWGVVVNGVNYVGNCPTRTGEYPYCNQMRLPSYSTAKSSFASVALMRLGQLRGAGIYSELIRKYVPEHTAGGQWAQVTFDNINDMATGNFISDGYQADEDSLQERQFIAAESYKEKIHYAFVGFPGKAPPGKVMVYHSHDFFILTQALEAFAGRDIFDLVRDDVLKPIHVSKGGQTTLRTDNSSKGKAFGSWGLFYDQDDIAKIANFLNTSNGVIDGRQVLEPIRLRESLFRANDEGLVVPYLPGARVPEIWRYSNGFWGVKFRPTEFPQYRCNFNVARMGGYGGISVVMMPNGTVYYVFSDNNEFGWLRSVEESNKLLPLC